MGSRAGCGVVAGLLILTVTADGQLAPDWTVSLRRAGPVAIGMTIGEARRQLADPGAYLLQALHQRQALPREPDDSPCAYLVTGKTPDIGLMFQAGRLARVDVWGPGIRTVSGAQIGDTEARILALYGSRIPYQLLFETDGTKVTQFRAGLRSAVQQVEGCA